MIFIVVMVFVMTVSMSVVVVTAFVVMMSMLRDVFVVVPVIAHEIDRPAAGVIFGAMFAPVLLMSGRDVQITRWRRCILRRPRNHDGLCKHNGRAGDIANINLAIEAGLADGDRYSYIAGKCWDGGYTQQ